MDTFLDRLQFLIDHFAGGKHTVFAKKAGIPTSTFQNYMKGRAPHSEHLLRIREIFKINLDWLLSGDGEKFVKEGKSENHEILPAGEPDALLHIHRSIIERFHDAERAKDANLDLLEIEKTDSTTFREVCAYIKGVSNGIKSASRSRTGEDQRRAEQGGVEATGTHGQGTTRHARNRAGSGNK